MLYYDNHSFLRLPCFGGIATSALDYKQDDRFGTRRDNAKGELTGRAEAIWDGDGSVIGYRLSAFYDDDRRCMVQSCTASPDGSSKRTSFAYDFEGNVTKSLHRHTTATGAMSEETDAYTYDNQGRLLTHTHSIDGGKPVLLARNTYDELGRLATTERGRSDRLDTRMEYDIRSNPTKIGGTLFTETLYYNRTNEGNTPQYGGNISAIDWETYNDGTTRPVFHGYNFTYDTLSRLTAADYLKNGRFRNNAYGTRYTYDLMGNALSVRRNGLLDDGTYGPIDDLTLHYDGNQLTKVTDATEGPYRKDAMHYVDGADAQEEFAYDANGNMTRNLDRHICSIRYNSLNLPRRIEFTDGSIVRYAYAATGEKLRVDYHINPLAASASAGMVAPRVDSTSLVHTWRTYTGNRIYDNDSLRMLLVDGGYVTLGGGKPQYHFYLRDHLGNNRVVADIDGNVEEVNHYYPYGALMDIGGSGNTTQPYKYVGKELDRTHGLDWYDHGARMNDPLTTGWHSPDEHSEEYKDTSPYAYCLGNPISNYDPDGKIVETIWDIANFTLDLKSLVDNIRHGNYGHAAVDAGATIIDAAAAMIPGIPGGVGTAVKAARTAKNANKADKGEKIFVTYTKINPKTKEVYVGRTSGHGKIKEIITKRDRYHHMNSKGFEKAKIDKFSTNYNAIRGREQHGIEHFGGAKSNGGTSGNTINGISPKNPKSKIYRTEDEKVFWKKW